MTTDNQPRRECRAADLRMWPLLYWTTDPTRLPNECRHLAGTPVERYAVDWSGSAVKPRWWASFVPASAFDVEAR